MAPVDFVARLKSLYSKHQGESIFLSWFSFPGRKVQTGQLIPNQMSRLCR